MTYTDSSGDTRISPWALSVIVGAICVPIVLAILIGVLTVEGTGPGLAAGALVVAALILLAVRARPHDVPGGLADDASLARKCPQSLRTDETFGLQKVAHW